MFEKRVLAAATRVSLPPNRREQDGRLRAALRDDASVRLRFGPTNACTLGGIASSYVDMYNATNNSWTRFPDGLGHARSRLAAASLPSGLVFFAGGSGM